MPIDPAIPIPPGTTLPGNPLIPGQDLGAAIRASDQAGGQNQAGLQNFFSIESLLLMVLGDRVNGHAGGGIHSATPTMSQGLAWFKVNGIPACRQGHLATCGHATSGRSWFRMVG